MNDAPPSDVAEISLIGTGYGEGIIVDSCSEEDLCCGTAKVVRKLKASFPDEDFLQPLRVVPPLTK